MLAVCTQSPSQKGGGQSRVSKRGDDLCALAKGKGEWKEHNVLRFALTPLPSALQGTQLACLLTTNYKEAQSE